MSSPPTTLVFYDGLCGLCDGFVRFLLRRDREGRMAFATLQGEIAGSTLLARGHDPADLDSVFVVADWKGSNERVLSRARAVVHAVSQLGGVWAVIAGIGGLAPTVVADAIYGFVARRRYRIFGRYETCPLPRPEWRGRFL